MNKNKCTLCKERNGNTRCEGCNVLFCLPCMNKHHDELTQKFQLLMDARNEIKQMLDNHELLSSNEKSLSCLNEINQWEQNVLQRIQEVAAKARINAKEIMMKYLDDLSHRFQPLSDNMQEQQKQGSYLDDDIATMKKALNELKNDIENIKIKFRVDYTRSDDIEWDTLISITEEELRNEATSESPLTNIETEEQASSNAIPIHVLNSNSLLGNSTITNVEQNAGRLTTCASCRKAFNGSSSRTVCSECDNQKPRIHTLPVNNNVRLSLQDMYSSMQNNSYNHILSTSHAGLFSYCPNCNMVNVAYRTPNSINYYCTICNHHVSGPYH